MKHSLLALVPTLLLVLACGGAGDLAGSDVGTATTKAASAPVRPRTARLCEHLAEKDASPCTPVAMGSSGTLGDFVFTARTVHTLDGIAVRPMTLEDRGPWKASSQKGLYVVVEIRNGSPVKAGFDFGTALHTSDGEEHLGMLGAMQAVAASTGHNSLLDMGDFGPDQEKTAVFAYAVPESAHAGAIFEVQTNEDKPDPGDPKGRIKNFVTGRLLLELDPPIPEE